jgi:hypothetical protein
MLGILLTLGKGVLEDEDPDELERRAKRIRAEREAERLRLQAEAEGYTAPNPDQLPVPPLLFNVVQTCRLLGGISKQTLYRKINLDEIHPVKVGKLSMFTMAELERFVKERQRESDDE